MSVPWTRCRLLNNFSQVVTNLAENTVEVSLDGESVETSLEQSATYKITSGTQVWIRAQNGLSGSAWEVEVSGSYDDTTTID